MQFNGVGGKPFRAALQKAGYLRRVAEEIRDRSLGIAREVRRQTGLNDIHCSRVIAAR